MMPKSAPNRPGTGAGSSGQTGKVVVAVLAVAAVAGAAVYLRARDDNAPSAAAVQQTQRYCKLSTRLESLLAGAGLPGDGSLPADVRPETVNQVFAQMGPQTEELELVAPSKVRGDVKTVLEGLRQAGAGDASRSSASGFAEARRRMSVHHQQLVDDPKSGCQEGAGSGEG